ncbi:hypothetical protein NE865_16362 [Phthorimaea operculella]|nr:hypothetical protein NE865_16362 [Phthorimaea operculella]
MSAMNSTRSSVGSHDRKLRYRAVLEDLSTLDDETANDHRMQKMESAVTEGKVTWTPGCSEPPVTWRCGAQSPSAGMSTSMTNMNWLSILKTPTSGSSHSHWKRRPSPSYSAHSSRTTAESTQETCGETASRREKGTEKIDKLEKSDQASETVVLVKKFLTRAYRDSGEQPISYFHLVIDPNSFSNTVENIYHVSFLVRDGLVSIELDEELGPFVRPISTKQQEQRDISDENQFIVSIDMGLWEELKEAFNIRKPMMVLKK